MKFSEIIQQIEDGKFEAAAQNISKLDDDGQIIVSTAFYNFNMKKYDECYELLMTIESIFDLFEKHSSFEEMGEETYRALLELYRLSIAYQIPLVVELSDYFYSIDKNVKSLFSKYEYLIGANNEFGDDLYQLALECIEHYDTEAIVNSYTIGVQHKITYILAKYDNPKGYELAMKISKDNYQEYYKFAYSMIKLLHSKQQEKFIIDLVEAFGDVVFTDTLDETMEVYELYLMALLNVKDKDLVPALQFLSNFDSMVIKYASEYDKYRNEISFDKKTLELINIIINNQFDLDDYEHKYNVYYYYIKNRMYQELEKFVIEQGASLSQMVYFAFDLETIDESYALEYCNYLVELNNQDHEYAYAIMNTLTALINKDEELFKTVFNNLDLEKNYDRVDSFLYNSLEDSNFYTVSLICNELRERFEESSDYYVMATSYMLALAVQYNDLEKFKDVYAECEPAIEKHISNINGVKIPSREIIEFLLTKTGADLYYVLKLCVKRYLFKNSINDVDIEFAKRILAKMDELYDEQEHKTESCYYTFLGTSKYVEGDNEEAIKLIEKSAYNSPDYCYCGMAYLLALKTKLYQEAFAKEHEEIVRKTIDGYKVDSNGGFYQTEFVAGPYFYQYYAYYALKGIEGYDLTKALEYLNTKCFNDIKKYYYEAMIFHKLGEEKRLYYALEDLKYVMNNEEVYEYEEEYLNILDNIHYKLIEPRYL